MKRVDSLSSIWFTFKMGCIIKYWLALGGLVEMGIVLHIVGF